MAEIVIQPGGRWFRFPWREVVQYRDLLFLLVRRDFVAKYKQTILGPAWFVLQPVMMTIVFTLVLNKVARISTGECPPLLFNLCGMLAWGYFAQCMQGTSSVFVSNASLFGKVYFPRLVVPLAIVVSNLIAFAIQLTTFVCFWLYYRFSSDGPVGFALTPYLFALPVLLLISGVTGLGVGLWMSALTAKYRDFTHLTGFLTQLWFFLTPVVYPMTMVKDALAERDLGHLAWLTAMNPMTGIVEAYRYAFLGVTSFEPLYLVVSAVAGAVLLVTGVLAFSRVERDFIDTV